ncbi:hypothetical protein M422DRAFT_264849 [Sphaerobolus stellatus SS14]|uniref:SWIM-type domain-containing protein n=1 Tax=Sphaerobolus stellatus (strain SS14) TaxID=990650 RepID=A0A0C9UEU2_SPHS4|nr:hypothetical protein M422DRAFT_264849 [Sphaerobolus stellatus SS14]
MSEEIEPDYMHAHVRIGIGFNSCHLCKAEQEAKKHAQALTPADAESRVRVVSDKLVMIDSFTKEEISYEVTLDDGGIIACSCPAFSKSGLGCKHMFLSQRITMFNILSEKSILPPPLPVLQPTTLTEQRDQKHVALDKAYAIGEMLHKDRFWEGIRLVEELDHVSCSCITQLLSAYEGLAHLQRDISLHRLEHAKQTH